jgi:hypothetical protein
MLGRAIKGPSEEACVLMLENDYFINDPTHHPKSFNGGLG